MATKLKAANEQIERLKIELSDAEAQKKIATNALQTTLQANEAKDHAEKEKVKAAEREALEKKVRPTIVSKFDLVCLQASRTPTPKFFYVANGLWLEHQLSIRCFYCCFRRFQRKNLNVEVKKPTSEATVSIVSSFCVDSRSGVAFRIQTVEVDGSSENSQHFLRCVFLETSCWLVWMVLHLCH